jgi:hypothetical protein
MSDIGKIEQLTTTHAGPLAVLKSQSWTVAQPSISLAEHDRTLKRVLAELHASQVERAHIVDVLTTFKQAPLSISSVRFVLDLLDELLDGPKAALCGPKEMVDR